MHQWSWGSAHLLPAAHAHTHMHIPCAVFSNRFPQLFSIPAALMGRAFASWLPPKVSFRALINTRPLVPRRTSCPTPDQVLQVVWLDDEPALDLLLFSLPPARLVSEAFQSRLFMVVITCALIDKVEKQHWFGVRVADLKCTATVMTTQFCTDNFSSQHVHFQATDHSLTHLHTHALENRKITEQLCMHTNTHTHMQVSYDITCYTASTLF